MSLKTEDSLHNNSQLVDMRSISNNIKPCKPRNLISDSANSANSSFEHNSSFQSLSTTGASPKFSRISRPKDDSKDLSQNCTTGFISPLFSSNNSIKPPLKVASTIDFTPLKNQPTVSSARTRAPKISSIGRSSSVKTCIENDFLAANAYTDFYPRRFSHTKKGSRSQTSLQSFARNGSRKVKQCSYAENNFNSSFKEQKPSATPKLQHANTISTLTYETAELLGTAVAMNNYWDNEQSESDVPKQRFNHHLKKLKSYVRHFIQPTDNRLALKLFGSKKAVLKEKKRCEEESPWIIHPYSTFRFLWDFLMLMLLICNLVVLPVAIAFFNEENSHSWAVFNCINDGIFIMDIVLNFRTGIPRQHMAVQVILDPKVIRRSYLKGWFIIDLISSMPMDYIFLIVSQGDKGGPQILNASRTLKMLRLMKFLSLVRLLRVSRLMRYATQWEEIFNLASAAIRILNLIFMMVLISHWNGCLMFLLPRIYEFPPDSWVVIDGLKGADWTEQYSWALFRAMSHMLCIGYGQQPPTSLLDLWLVMVSMLSGATCYALFIGHATNMIQQFDSSRRQYTEKIKQVEEYMGHRKLPPDLQVRVHEYYEYKYKGKMFDEEVILEELNDCLREEILNYNCRELVNVVPFFQGADPLFVSGVVSKLKFEVFQPGDLILSEGTFGTKMYFIQQGTVDVMSSDDQVIAQLTDGAYFGEICLLTKCRRTASIRAESYCNVYSLEVDDFNEVVREFPEVRDKMEDVARLRLKQLGRKPSQVFQKSKLRPLMQELFDHSDEEINTDFNEELVSNVAKLTMRKLSVLLESNQHISPCKTSASSSSVSGSGPSISPNHQRKFGHPQHAIDPIDTILESDSDDVSRGPQRQELSDGSLNRDDVEEQGSEAVSQLGSQSLDRQNSDNEGDCHLFGFQVSPSCPSLRELREQNSVTSADA